MTEKNELSKDGSSSDTLTKKRSFKDLLKDKRSYQKRLKIALFPILAFVFTLFFYGPLDIAISNASELIFGIGDVLLNVGIFSLLLAAVLIFLIPLARRRLFNYILLLISGTTIAMYIQCYLLNFGTIKEITGDKNEIPPHILIINSLLWLALLVLPFILCKLSKRCIRPIIRYIPVLLIVLQLAGLTVTVFDKLQSEGFNRFVSIDKQKYYLSNKDIYNYSKKDNVVVFLLDRFDYDYIEAVKEKDPDFFDKLDGFTCYTNVTSEFSRTLPGANHLLTGNEDGAFSMPVNEYLDKTWTANCGKSIIEELSKNGYKVDMYANIKDFMSQENPLIQNISNADDKELKINRFLLINRMVSLSAHRYAPAAIKDLFLVYSVNDIMLDNEKYSENDSEFRKGLLSEHLSLSIDTDEKNFKFYHLTGPHAPYKLNPDGSESMIATNVTDQTMGVFSILYTIFDEMKALGIYDSSTIIITADHGDDVSAEKELTKATCIALFCKPSGSSGEKLNYDNRAVSQKNIPPMILKVAGVADYSDFGTPFDELTDDSNAVRYHYKAIVVGTSEKYVCKYEITDDAKDIKNWKLVERFDVSDSWKN